MRRVILNKPIPSTRKGKKLMVYVKDKAGKVKVVHFGDSRYKHNYSKKAWESYQARSAGIRDKYGRLTKDNKLSANYWARRVLWKRK